MIISISHAACGMTTPRGQSFSCSLVDERMNRCPPVNIAEPDGPRHFFYKLPKPGCVSRCPRVEAASDNGECDRDAAGYIDAPRQTSRMTMPRRGGATAARQREKPSRLPRASASASAPASSTRSKTPGRRKKAEAAIDHMKHATMSIGVQERKTELVERGSVTVSTCSACAKRKRIEAVRRFPFFLNNNKLQIRVPSQLEQSIQSTTGS